MKFCPSCGTKCEDSMRFCQNCGSALPSAPNSGNTNSGSQNTQQRSNTNTYQNQYQNKNQYQNQYQNPNPNSGFNTYQRPTNGMGVAALVLGIIGCFISWFTLGIPSILAIIFGALGIVKASKDPQYGKGTSIAGLILGIIIFAIFIISVIIAAATVSYVLSPYYW